MHVLIMVVLFFFGDLIRPNGMGTFIWGVLRCPI